MQGHSSHYLRCSILYEPVRLCDGYRISTGLPPGVNPPVCNISLDSLDGGLSANQYQQAEAVRLILPLKTLRHRSAAAPCINQQPQTVTLLKQGLIPPNLSSTKQQQILFQLNLLQLHPQITSTQHLFSHHYSLQPPHCYFVHSDTNLFTSICLNLTAIHLTQIS